MSNAPRVTREVLVSGVPSAGPLEREYANVLYGAWVFRVCQKEHGGSYAKQEVSVIIYSRSWVSIVPESNPRTAAGRCGSLHRKARMH